VIGTAWVFFRGIMIYFIIVKDDVSNDLTNVYKIINKFIIDITIINFIASITRKENITSDIDITIAPTGLFPIKIKLFQSYNFCLVGSTEYILKIH
jgi:archaellin